MNTEGYNDERRVAGWEGGLDIGVMFVDLVDSSIFSSVLSLKDYSEYVLSFQETMRIQCEHFFEKFLAGRLERNVHYNFEIVGDELVVFMHSDKSANDIYLLATLAITLKAAWLASPMNSERIHRRAAAAELAVGINFGRVWARRQGNGYRKEGYAINLAKRIESHSRGGNHYRIFLSDGAFKQIHRRMRNLLFSPRLLISGKGIVGQFGVYEIVDSFADTCSRLAPSVLPRFEEIMEAAIDNSSRDLWIHSAYQLHSSAENECVTPAAAERCRSVLAYDPGNPVALYYLAQFYREQGQHGRARISFRSLLDSWPSFGDGFLELGDYLAENGKVDEAKDAYRQALRLGILEAGQKIEEL